ncbi:ferric-chelate reductase like protein [Zymoseptoria brevis]|uniref:ferric-chelate reductase (NADPH) n=1 Tax=Zymoseptoria brevis TaxID=1047168 RepID=A0A0F4GAR2_9PEZI|nr:ferric-chelate reductase like protein [Zymoseptoria brevis]
MDDIAAMSGLERRHIQDHNAANVKYWAYPARVLPCTKDQGTCEYLEAVYSGHVTSMLYTFIMWGVILGVLASWATWRVWRTGKPSHGIGSLVSSACDRAAKLKRHFLPDAPMRSVFGRVSRLQVAVLAVVSGYLLIFSLVGIVYKTWVTPIAKTDLFNTRTGIGPWSDRIGALAYALTPFTIMLCMRESVLSIVTGIPYQHFNFLHRWLGRIIFVQSFLHTLGWTLVEARFYQPQPKVYVAFITQQYAMFGVVAMFLITWLTLFSTQWAIRRFGYEFFKASHWIIAVLYIGACWGHWDKLYCWMIPSLALIAIDQAVRFGRTIYIHMGGKRGTSSGFKCAQAEMTVLTDDNGTVIRLDFDHEHAAWEAGQHFFLTFPTLSIWQAHPFTVTSAPEPNSRIQHHTYLLRVRNGQTKKLAALGNTTVPTILSGPYGHGFPRYECKHMLAVSGGTGVTFTMPIIIEAVKQSVSKRAVLDFVWIVRKAEDLLWLSDELSQLKNLLKEAVGLRISIYVSRDSERDAHKSEKRLDVEKTDSSDSSLSASSDVLEELLAIRDSRFAVHFLKDHHPSVAEILADFQERAVDHGGSAEIIGSGPEALGSDLRAAVAASDIGEEVKFYWDSRG